MCHAQPQGQLMTLIRVLGQPFPCASYYRVGFHHRSAVPRSNLVLAALVNGSQRRAVQDNRVCSPVPCQLWNVYQGPWCHWRGALVSIGQKYAQHARGLLRLTLRQSNYKYIDYCSVLVEQDINVINNTSLTEHRFRTEEAAVAATSKDDRNVELPRVTWINTILFNRLQELGCWRLVRGWEDQAWGRGL